MMGISRSATVVIAYLIAKKGMKFNEALEFVQSKREIVDPNGGFKLQLMDYEEKLKKARGVDLV